MPLHRHQHHRQLPLPSQSTTAPWEAEGRNENIGEQSWRKTHRRRGRKADHHPSHSPGCHHQHLHEAAAEREERCWQREQRKQREKAAPKQQGGGRRPQQQHRQIGHQHHRQPIYPGSSSQVILPLITFGCSSSCMQNVHCARSASKKLISWLLCRCTVTSLCSFRAGTSAQPMQPGWVQPCRSRPVLFWADFSPVSFWAGSGPVNFFFQNSKKNLSKNLWFSAISLLYLDQYRFVFLYCKDTNPVLKYPVFVKS